MRGSLIVCIENDPAILDGMRTLLKAWDAEVIAVADPDAAIAAIEAAGRRSPACWSTIISTAATASPRSATFAAASATTSRRS